jgi:hypothetical protein
MFGCGYPQLATSPNKSPNGLLAAQWSACRSADWSMPEAALLSSEACTSLGHVLSLAVRASLSVPHAERPGFVGQWLKDHANGADGAAEAPAASHVNAEELLDLSKQLTRALNLTITSGTKDPTVLALAEVLLNGGGASSPSRQSGAYVEVPGWMLASFSKWTDSLVDVDPRKQILRFFMTGDERGPAGVVEHLEAASPTGAKDARTSRREAAAEGRLSEYFSVWRPTSLDAIRMMMMGRATGKSLNVTGHCSRTVPGQPDKGTAPALSTAILRCDHASHCAVRTGVWYGCGAGQGQVGEEGLPLGLRALHPDLGREA